MEKTLQTIVDTSEVVFLVSLCALTFYRLGKADAEPSTGE